ncbi:MAG TPA: hypothetical protein VN065_15170, partial [Bradyrhizobium sp.]|nr:hypothetical protein [Bradyrhizobium sp.]
MHEAQTRNLEIPGSLALLAPRNDGISVFPVIASNEEFGWSKSCLLPHHRRARRKRLRTRAAAHPRHQ